MKTCYSCNPPQTKPDTEFCIDRKREDGLALICRDCNSAKLKRWYEANKEAKKAKSLAYKREHGPTPHVPAVERKKRETVQKQEAKAEEPEDWQTIRFSRSEWLFCLQEAQEAGMKAQEYVRALVRDARDRQQRRTFLQDREEK